MILGIDAHCHVFAADGVDPTELVGHAAYRPPMVSVDDHTQHLATMGYEHVVLVQPSAYGTSDHRCLLASLRARPDHLRAVASIQPGTSAETIETMHAAGVRATRVQDGYPGGVPVQALPEVAQMVRPWGWHIEIWTDVRRHHTWLGDAIRRSPVPVMIDHLGYIPSDVPLKVPALQLMVELLRDGDVWVALSGLDRLLPAAVGTDPAAPGFDVAWARHEEAITQRAQAFVQACPTQIIWGTDWPHVGLQLPHPDGPTVRERLNRWVPDPRVRQQILIDNAVRCYDFTAPTAESVET